MPCGRRLSGLRPMALLGDLYKRKEYLTDSGGVRYMWMVAMVRRDTLRTSYCRWTSRETSTYQRRRSEEHHSRCIPVALGKRGVGTKCCSGASRTAGTAVRRADLGIACGARD